MYLGKKKMKRKQEKNQAVQAMLTEYTALRAEAQMFDSIAIAIATLNFTLLGVIVTLVLKESEASVKLMQWTFYFIIPCLSMFFGLLWVDQLFRRARFGAYFSYLEEKINAVTNEIRDRMEWERWNKKRYVKKTFLFKTNQYYGYFVLGSNLALPLVSVGLGRYVLDIIPNRVLLIVIGVVYMVFLAFCGFYCREILSLNAMVKGYDGLYDPSKE